MTKPAAELSLLTKRKDYHAEYVEAASPSEPCVCKSEIGDNPACLRHYPGNSAPSPPPSVSTEPPYCQDCGDSEEAIIHQLDDDDDAGHKFKPASEQAETAAAPGRTYLPDIPNAGTFISNSAPKTVAAPSVAGTQPTCKVCNLPKFNVWSTAPPGTMIYDLPKYFCNCMDGGTWGLSNLPSQQMTAHSGTLNPGAAQGTPQVEEIKADKLFGIYCNGNPMNTPWMLSGIRLERCHFWDAWQKVADYVNRKHGVGAPAQQGSETFLCEQCKTEKPIAEQYPNCEDSTICNSCAEEQINGKSL